MVINWNVPELLDDCLQSIYRVMQSSDVSVDVVVVDSASSIAGHREVLKRYPDASLIQLQENCGYGAACNAGARKTTGSAILFLNPDTLLHAGALDDLFAAMHLAPHIGLVAPLLLNANGSIQSMGYRFPGAVNILCDLIPVPDRLYQSSLNGRMQAGNGRFPVAIDYALGAALMARREAFEHAGGFDESFFMYSEEVDFQRRLAETDWTRLLVPTARITHLGGQSTGQQPDDMYSALWQSRIQYFDRWAGARQRATVRLAARIGFAIDSRRHPKRSTTNRAILNELDRSLAGS